MSTKYSRGFALIEVLIAVVILAVGILGLAGLQVVGMRNNNNAYLRTQITQQIYDVIDRMRTNMPAVILGNYVLPATSTVTAPANGCSRASSADVNNCDSTQLAADDLNEWMSGLAGHLPPDNWTLAITCADANAVDGNPCSDGSVHTVTVTWNELDNAVAAGNRDINVAVSFRP